SRKLRAQFDQELQEIVPKINPDGDNWVPGDAPSQVLIWAVQALAKAGTLSIVGVYPQPAHNFPIGQAMNKNLTIHVANCPHRRYLPRLVDLVRNGTVDPTRVLTQQAPLMHALDAYKAFDERQAGWVKVELLPTLVA